MAETQSTKAKKLKFQPTSRQGKEFRTWFRGEHTNALPHNRHFYKQGGVEKYVLQGWAPDAPVITARTQVTAFGSCFAANISNWLSKRSYNVLNKAEDAGNSYVVECGEGMVNSFVILQQFEWAWENKVFDQALWHGYDTTEYGYDPKVERFFWFAGQGGYGIQTAPAAARLGAQLLLYKDRDQLTAKLDAALYSPARFH